MLSQIVLLVLGGLVVTPVSWWLQQGTSRQRRRKEILADLELAEKIREKRPDAATRIDRRVDRALERYAPVLPGPRSSTVTALTALSMFVAFIVFVPAPTSLWLQLASGAAIGLVANLFGLAWEQVAERRAAAPSGTVQGSGAGAGGA